MKQPNFVTKFNLPKAQTPTFQLGNIKIQSKLTISNHNLSSEEEEVEGKN